MIDAWATYLLLKLQHFENGRGLLLVIHYTREKVPQEHRGALIKKEVHLDLTSGQGGCPERCA